MEKTNMQLRETKLTPLEDVKTLVELLYSDHEDPDRASALFRLRSVQTFRPRSTIVGVKHQTFRAFLEWAQEESNRLDVEMLNG